MSQNQLEIVVDPIEPIITTRRVVNAPRALVWDCYTKPEHVRRWKGPKELEMLVCECDVRPGGKWRVRYRNPNGDEFGFHGDFSEVVVSERFVRTFVMDGSADGAIETLELTEVGPNKTLITNTNEYKTKAIRDCFVQQGTESTLKDCHRRLDELLASLAPRSGSEVQATTS